MVRPPVYPCSSRSRSKMRWAVCRCFGGACRSSSRMCVDDGEERPELRLGPGPRLSVARRLGLGEDLLERLPVQPVLARTPALALAVHQHAAADLGPLVHVGVHPRPPLRLPRCPLPGAILARRGEVRPRALHFSPDRRSPPDRCTIQASFTHGRRFPVPSTHAGPSHTTRHCVGSVPCSTVS